MIICRTPLRISFFGGGTDYPVWYEDNKGAVISATINKYSFITVRWLPPFFDHKYRIRYFQKEEVSTLDKIQHPSVRESAKFLGINRGFEVTHTADLPAQSGLGSSSTFTVGMLHAFHTLCNRMVTKRELALQAIDLEQNRIGEAVGSQDQAAAAFGGFNLIRFSRPREFEVEPLVCSGSRLRQLQDSLLLVFTGFSRSAHELAKVQIALTPSKAAELRALSRICDQALDILSDSERCLDELGGLLHEQWEIKKQLTPLVSTNAIDQIYEIGMSNGAIGGKLLGAGGGGFMLFYAPVKAHLAIKHALKEKLVVPFRFESTGSQIIYFSHSESP